MIHTIHLRAGKRPGGVPVFDQQANPTRKAVMKYLLCTAAALTLALTGCGGGSPLTLTQDNLDKVQPDMSPTDVKAILGDPTSSSSKTIPLVGGTETDYVYSNPQNGTEVTIVFKNDKETDKTGTFNK
jgi:predicted small lipoprotein YifL